MSKSSKVPDAWDDDWEAQPDPAQQQAPAALEPKVPLTKKERWARHAETQRKLWEEAEAPEEPNYMTINNTVPLTSGFKPAMKLLSRKPAPQMIAKRDPVTGMQKMTLQDDEDDDDEKKPQPTVEEIRERQQREREEKQRRYNEARAKIFGEPTPPSRSSTPGTTTPPEGRQNPRGRGRGGRGGGGGGGRNDNRQGSDSKQDGQGNRRSQTQQTGARELFDPGYSPKPGFGMQKRGGEPSTPSPGRSTTPRQDEQPIRAPRGPDCSGRGGFGFARRGGSQES